MSELRDVYTKGLFPVSIGDLEVSPIYLGELASRGAMEIDNFRLGRNNDFSHVFELAGILEKFQLGGSAKTFPYSLFPYHALQRFLVKESDKSVTKVPELALEMRLFCSELGDVPTDAKKMSDLCHALCGLSQEFLREESSRPLIRYVA